MKKVEISWDYEATSDGSYIAWVNEFPSIVIQTKDLEKAGLELLWLLNIKWFEEAKDNEALKHSSNYTKTSRPLASISAVA